ncbi:hypothetical protein DXG01_015705 [Tephrocybe rancida]|nr:hypothetical protein DXG01_015705 [Tephrocybe rancida]
MSRSPTVPTPELERKRPVSEMPHLRFALARHLDLVPGSREDILDESGLLVTAEIEKAIEERKLKAERIVKECRAKNRKFRDVEFDRLSLSSDILQFQPSRSHIRLSSQLCIPQDQQYHMPFPCPHLPPELIAKTTQDPTFSTTGPSTVFSQDFHTIRMKIVDYRKPETVNTIYNITTLSSARLVGFFPATSNPLTSLASESMSTILSLNHQQHKVGPPLSRLIPAGNLSETMPSTVASQTCTSTIASMTHALDPPLGTETIQQYISNSIDPIHPPPPLVATRKGIEALSARRQRAAAAPTVSLPRLRRRR